jgi:hypothetical protein
MKNAWHNFSPKIFRTVFLFNWDVENVSEYSVLRNKLRKYILNGKTLLNLTKFRQNFHPVWAKMMANLFRGGISALHIDNLIDWTNICANEKGRRFRF